MSTTRWLVVIGLLLITPGEPLAQSGDDFVPVTDAMLQDPAPSDWLMWRRTLNGWAFSPLDQIDRENVGDLRMVWSRALSVGSQQGTPLVYDGVMYMPNPRDVIQAIDAATGDLIWEYRCRCARTSAHGRVRKRGPGCREFFGGPFGRESHRTNPSRCGHLG